MRFYVTLLVQNALFRRVRFPHLRKHGTASRKSALCALDLT